MTDINCWFIVIGGLLLISFPSSKIRDNNRNLFLESKGYKLLRIKEGDYIKLMELLKKNYSDDTDCSFARYILNNPSLFDKSLTERFYNLILIYLVNIIKILYSFFF